MSTSNASSDPPALNNSTDTNGTGLVIVNYGKSLLIEDSNGKLIRCVPRRNLELIVCGDHVTWESAGDGTGVVTRIAVRETVLNRTDGENRVRPLAANLDQIAIVAASEPALDEFLVDKYTVAAELVGVQPLLIINKSDLLDNNTRESLEQRVADYADIGYRILFTSVLNNTGMPELEQALTGRTSILVGQSGVGKSSLIKRVLPGLEIATGRLSAASGQGRHTTTTTTLYHLSCGGKLIDSPGVRDFRLGHASAVELESGFREFRNYLGQCRFHNCRHLAEPDCAVADAAQQNRIDPRRLESYRQLVAGLS
ncbi:MAG: ribosome small subunit-dependent GTPase A [Thiohalobacterales bacterium]